MSYTYEQITAATQKAMSEIKYLYKDPVINLKGKFSKSPNLYTEVIAGLLSRDIKQKLSQLPQIRREKDYPKHNNIGINPASNRHEDKYAQYLMSLQMDLRIIGKIVEYQIPLKNSREDCAGKIDLISKNEAGVNLIEFKHGSNSETLLRAVLEIATYYQLFNCLENRIKLKECIGHPVNEPIGKMVVVSEGTQAAVEANEVILGKRPELTKLIKILNVKVFILKISNIDVVDVGC